MFAAFNQHCMLYERGIIVFSMQKYIISIVSAAIICGIISGLIGKKGTYPAIVRLLCGLFIVITAISPLKSISLNALPDYFSDIQSDAKAVTNQAISETKEDFFRRIKEQTETYILDKASELGLSIDATVQYSTKGEIKPEQVIITGDASPYKKMELKRFIATQLNIPEEAQIWN